MLATLWGVILSPNRRRRKVPWQVFKPSVFALLETLSLQITMTHTEIELFLQKNFNTVFFKYLKKGQDETAHTYV